MTTKSKLITTSKTKPTKVKVAVDQADVLIEKTNTKTKSPVTPATSPLTDLPTVMDAIVHPSAKLLVKEDIEKKIKDVVPGATVTTIKVSHKQHKFVVAYSGKTTTIGTYNTAN